MKPLRPYILSIAGFDPSGGAGVLADIKTAEAHGVYGLGVVSALTVQNDREFESVRWVEWNEIKAQTEILLKRFPVRHVKIGLIRDMETFSRVVDLLRHHVPDIHITWDPILKATAGYEFHAVVDEKELTGLLRKINLVTPNADEAVKLSSGNDAMAGSAALAKYCDLFLKGGHLSDKRGRDYLFTGTKSFSFRPGKISDTTKHGSGCVLSSAIAANLANGYSLPRACLKAKDYITEFMLSNKTLLGYHKI